MTDRVKVVFIAGLGRNSGMLPGNRVATAK